MRGGLLKANNPNLNRAKSCYIFGFKTTRMGLFQNDSHNLLDSSWMNPVIGWQTAALSITLPTLDQVCLNPDMRGGLQKANSPNLNTNNDLLYLWFQNNKNGTLSKCFSQLTWLLMDEYGDWMTNCGSVHSFTDSGPCLLESWHEGGLQTAPT